MNFGFIQNLHLAIGWGTWISRIFMGTFAAPQSAAHFISRSVIYASSFADCLTILGFQSDALLRLRGFVLYFYWDKDCLRDRFSCKFKILASLLGCLSRWSRLVRFDEYKWFYFRHSLGFRDGMFHFGFSRFLAGLSCAQISAWREYARKLVA